jgi:signal transduction histidine kinase
MMTAPIKILLVDDRKENLFALESLLSDLDVSIYKASSGTNALELLLDHDFALGILDVQMPEMNGFELAEFMRGAARTKNIPIIFVTAASKMQGFAFKGYESGAVDFLYKPIDPVVLKSKARVFVDLYKQKALLSEKLTELKQTLFESDRAKEALARSEAELKTAKEAAETADRLKSAFLANMSHEIRTPLGAIMGFADLLKDVNLPSPEGLQYLNIIGRNGKTLVRLIDDILDLSKVESGHLQIEKIAFSITEATKEIVDLLQTQAQAKSVDLKLEFGPGLPDKIASDPVRLKQILLNVIGNAIKFTEKGLVHISVQVSADRRNPGLALTFWIRDTGIGLSEEQVGRLFQPFSQADNSITRRFGGTGLGLLLSRRLARALGGEIELTQSAIGEGSTFKISFDPIEIPQSITTVDHQLPSTPSTKAEGTRVLLVEDSPDNRLLIQRILKKSGVIMDMATDGHEGVQKAMQNEYDVVLMDLQMPHVDGFAATRQLRKNGYSKPIIALTAHAMREERERCLKEGFDDHLSKPVDRVALLEAVSKYRSLTHCVPK